MNVKALLIGAAVGVAVAYVRPAVAAQLDKVSAGALPWSSVDLIGAIAVVKFAGDPVIGLVGMLAGITAQNMWAAGRAVSDGSWNAGDWIEL